MVVVDPVAAQQSHELGEAAQDKLERLYQVDPEPAGATIEMIAAASGSPVPAVDRWFEQRRARAERQVAGEGMGEADEILIEGSEVGLEDLARANRALMSGRGSDSDSDSDSEIGPEPEPELQPEPEQQALPTPDFNGRWVLAETVGMEPFLVALDIGY
eukprot:COSAG02_NODE_19602_length_873_cov_3.127907_2_plen_158_part_01